MRFCDCYVHSRGNIFYQGGAGRRDLILQGVAVVEDFKQNPNIKQSKQHLQMNIQMNKVRVMWERSELLIK